MMAGSIGPLASALLGIAMLAVFALLWGGAVTLRRGDRRRGVLMLVCAAVVLGNILIWTV
jgi:hypothetical protein